MVFFFQLWTSDTVRSLLQRITETTKFVVKLCLKMCILVNLAQFLSNISPSYSFPFMWSCQECFCSPEPRFSVSRCSPSDPPEDHRERALVTSLGADRLALLQQIHLARVIIESLKIPPESIQISPRRKGLLGKPPRPMSVHKW